MAYAKIRPRRGTLYEWTSVNPILAEGELAVEVPESGVGTGLCKCKIGDGKTHYNDLPYAFDAEATSSVFGGNVYEFNYICLRSGTTEEWESLDPVLELGEIVYDETTGGIKIGDGVSRWSELPYIGYTWELEGDYDFGDEDEGSASPIDPDYTDYDFGDDSLGT